MPELPGDRMVWVPQAPGSGDSNAWGAGDCAAGVWAKRAHNAHCPRWCRTLALVEMCSLPTLGWLQVTAQSPCSMLLPLWVRPSPALGPPALFSVATGFPLSGALSSLPSLAWLPCALAQFSLLYWMGAVEGQVGVAWLPTAPCRVCPSLASLGLRGPQLN